MATSNSTPPELPSAQALQSREQMSLLNAVDALRAYGLGEITALPQLVVCGDQSSGKSSVLEAISGIPFPRKDGTCTRFATEVILRRARDVHMEVSIVPSPDLPPEDRRRLLAFRRELSSIDDFKELFGQAKSAMRISDMRESFSKDVLRVEFWGPNQPQLTLVDLPGLIHTTIGEQVPGDVQLINNLVTSYLENPRSIILAIAAANYDLNLQIVLSRARAVDPGLKRTLGIITKPDLIKGETNESIFIKTARNESVPTALGWHVVKNMESGIADQKDRDREETEFFKNSFFSVLPQKQVGITSLRSRLSSVLFDQIKAELPRLIEEIEKTAIDTQAERNKLGQSRSEPKDQQRFLIGLSESFQNICRDAIAGHYDHEFFREDPNGKKRLCANLMNKHFKFAKALVERGALWKITQDEEDGHSSALNDSEYTLEGDEGRRRTRREAIEDACKVLKRSRGRELPGLPNPLLVGELFREYSRPWEELARNHIADVWHTTISFLELVLHHLTVDDVCDKIFLHWLDPMMAKSLSVAYVKLDELLEVHKDHPLTTNQDFIENRRKLQEKREKETFIDMDLTAAEDAFDNMNAYYKVALNLFMDNVPNLAIQAPIVRKLPDMLSPTAVTNMSPEVIKNIAGESKERISERNDMDRLLEKLKEGARICKEYTFRSIRVPPPDVTSSNSTTQQTGRGRKVSTANDDSIPVRRHAPSASEDGRATSRTGQQTLHRESSSKLNTTLQVPDPASIQRPASAGLFDKGASATSHFEGFNSPKATSGTKAKPKVKLPPTREPSGLNLFGATNSTPGTAVSGSGLLGSLNTTPGAAAPGSGLFGFLSATTGTGATETLGTAPRSTLFGSSGSGSGSAFGSGSSSTFGSAIGSGSGSGLGVTSAKATSSATDSTSKASPSYQPAESSKSTSTFVNPSTAEVLPKPSIFTFANIFQMITVAHAPPTYSFCRSGFSPYGEITEPHSAPEAVTRYHAITCDVLFRKYSPEELRLADYAAGCRHTIKRPELEFKTFKGFSITKADDDKTFGGAL